MNLRIAEGFSLNGTELQIEVVQVWQLTVAACRLYCRSPESVCAELEDSQKGYIELIASQLAVIRMA